MYNNVSGTQVTDTLAKWCVKTRNRVTGVNDCRTVDVLPNIMFIWTEASGTKEYNVIFCMNKNNNNSNHIMFFF